MASVVNPIQFIALFMTQSSVYFKLSNPDGSPKIQYERMGALSVPEPNIFYGCNQVNREGWFIFHPKQAELMPILTYIPTQTVFHLPPPETEVRFWMGL